MQAKQNFNVPKRVLILGSSLLLGHQMSAQEFKNMMIKQFGFGEGEDLASAIFIEFFNDQYEEETAAAKSLIEALKRVADRCINLLRIPERPTSMLICFTGAAELGTDEGHYSQPEFELRFWKEFQHALYGQSDGVTSQLMIIFKPTFIQSSSSENMGARVKAFTRDSCPFLGSSIVIP